MAGTPDPVLSYLDDVLGTCVDTLIRVALLSEFIDEDEPLEIAKGVKKRMLELRTSTLEWRAKRGEILEPPTPHKHMHDS